MNLSTHTGLGRHLDIRLPSNLFVVAGSVIAGAVALGIPLLRDGEFDLFGAATIGIAVFVAWAIGRELDPDHNLSAGVALVLAGLGALLGPQAPGAAAVILLATRLLSGTVGMALKPADLVVLVFVGGYAGTRPEAWPAGLLLAVTLLVVPRHGHVVVAGLIVVAGVAAAVVTGTVPDPGSLSGVATALVVAAVLATGVIARVRHVATMSDGGEHPIAAGRVAAARLGASASVVIGSLLLADGGAVALIPVTAALVGVAIARGRRLVTTPSQPAGRALEDHTEPARR